tara:strand:+ start:46141 stop:46761 length:621 start_codon:yes stop_codon:yes gene_type:complete
MTFPDKKFVSVDRFCDEYFKNLSEAAALLDREAISTAANTIESCFNEGKWLYVCGNGGSAAIANHLLCDFAKCIQTDTHIKPKVISLSSNLEIITAISNDISYEDCFSYQLSTSAQPGDTLITISASGDSENIVRATQWASQNKLNTISLTGFDGGRSASIADINIHVFGNNYGIIEDIHHSIMHIISQYLRQSYMDEETISKKTF